MTDAELFALDQNGFIPGPGESESDFLARVARVKKKFKQGEWIPPAHWDWVREYLTELYHVKPLYICAFYSNRNLALWEGAASWIDGKELSAIQLRSGLKKGRYLGIYSREEILAHEAVHAARSAFEENRYEEFFAYMTSEKKWRRALGPILQRPWEVWPFFLAMLGGLVWPGAYALGSLWLLAGFSRLIRQHWRLRRAAQNIFTQVRDKKTARAVMFRLTDAEIDAFSRGKDIRTYALGQRCLRWRVIQNYLKGESRVKENHG